MKQILLLALVIGTTISTSCSKKSDSTDLTPEPTTVTINGDIYHTAKIGTQIWTIDEYKGPGGRAETLSGDLVGTALFYTYTQATTINLPTGWRLPSQSDYNKLLLYLGGTTDSQGYGTASGSVAAKLVTSEWPYANGTDNANFNAGPLGFYNSTTSAYEGVEQVVAYWTSSQQPNSSSYCGFVINNYLVNNIRPLTAFIDFYKPTDGLCVRFVKDN